jgi:hypothetical protein
MSNPQRNEPTGLIGADAREAKARRMQLLAQQQLNQMMTTTRMCRVIRFVLL